MEVAGRPPTPIYSPAELARYLTFRGVKVSEQMMTNWKARGVSRDKSIDVAAILGTTADYILYGKEPTGMPTLQLVRDPILDDLAALPPHEAEIFKIQIKAAADIWRAKQRAATIDDCQQQERDRRKHNDPPPIERRCAPR